MEERNDTHLTGGMSRKRDANNLFFRFWSFWQLAKSSQSQQSADLGKKLTRAAATLSNSDI